MFRLLAVLSVALLTETFGRPVEEARAAANEDYPRYAFNYAVRDPHSRDDKAQWEERDGDVVKGAYSLREPDGSLRVVEYTASDAVGFNAVVKNVGPNVHPVTVGTKAVAPVRVPVVAPVAPLHIAAPIVPIIPEPRLINAPIVQPYGIASLALGVPKSTLLGESSLPWDPVSGSYGGWVPLPSGPSELKAYVISKKNIGGHVRKVVIGPIQLAGKILRVITKN